MKKFLFLILNTLLVLSLLLNASACNKSNQSDIAIDDEGNVIKPSGGKSTEITFWGYGDDNEIVRESNNIMELPTLLFYKNGVEIKKAVGIITQENLSACFEECLNTQR